MNVSTNPGLNPWSTCTMCQDQTAAS